MPIPKPLSKEIKLVFERQALKNTSSVFFRRAIVSLLVLTLAAPAFAQDNSPPDAAKKTESSKKKKRKKKNKPPLETVKSKYIGPSPDAGQSVYKFDEKGEPIIKKNPKVMKEKTKEKTIEETTSDDVSEKPARHASSNVRLKKEAGLSTPGEGESSAQGDAGGEDKTYDPGPETDSGEGANSGREAVPEHHH